MEAEATLLHVTVKVPVYPAYTSTAAVTSVLLTTTFPDLIRVALSVPVRVHVKSAELTQSVFLNKSVIWKRVYTDPPDL